MQELAGKIRAAVEKYHLIEEGDRIAVGVSGGKDSLVLLCALASLQRYSSSHFSLTALTADPCFGNIQTDYHQIQELCRRLNVPYRIRRTSLGHIVFEERKESSPCSLCARMRRGILHNMAKESGCNKIALGHHLDDAVETFFMNLFLSGKIGCFSPKSYLSRKDLTLIRPMIFCEEKEIASTARRLHLPVVKSACPADGETSRQEMKFRISGWEKEFPDLRTKVIGALQRTEIDGWGNFSSSV